jgi:hypothetical protein
MEFVAVMFTEKFPAEKAVPERTPVVAFSEIQEGISVGFSIEKERGAFVAFREKLNASPTFTTRTAEPSRPGGAAGAAYSS